MDAGIVFRVPDIRGALETLNVRHVIIGDEDPDLRALLDSAAGLRRRATLSRFFVYDVDVRPSYIMGTERDRCLRLDRVDVRLDDAVDEITLEFRWAPGLVSDPPLPPRAGRAPARRAFHSGSDHRHACVSCTVRSLLCWAREMWARWRSTGP